MKEAVNISSSCRHVCGPGAMGRDRRPCGGGAPRTTADVARARVLSLMAAGFTDGVIARTLRVCEHTLRVSEQWFRPHVPRQLDVANLAEASRHAPVEGC